MNKYNNEIGVMKKILRMKSGTMCVAWWVVIGVIFLPQA